MVDTDSHGKRLLSVFSVLFLIQMSGWGLAIANFSGQPATLALAGVAFALGLRHALDADHIAAIDNFTRRITERGERPAAVGLFFSIGHSGVVVGASFLVAVASANVGSRFAPLRDAIALCSTILSVGVLLILAPMNLVASWRLYIGARDDTHVNGAAHGGLLARLFSPLMNLTHRSWHMMPLGVLFGLGFETATAIAALGLAASQTHDGLSLGAAMAFPLLFTAGMTLVDTLEALLMVNAYSWALTEPKRKLYYNLVVTALSAFVGFTVGGVELLALWPHKNGAGLWPVTDLIAAHFEDLGVGIVALFVVIWFGAWLIARLRESTRMSVEPS